MSHPSQTKAYLALLAVWIFWGTTYLAIRMALESMSPLVLLSTRFLASGGLMLVGVKLSGAKIPAGRELWLTAIFGILCLGFGNGGVVFAEVTVPSGLTALMITTGAFWMVGIEAVLPGGQPIHLPTMGGILIGLLGVVLLLAPTGAASSWNAALLPGILLIQLGVFSWSLGAVLQKRLQARAHPVVSGAVQQFASGLTYLPLALLVPHANPGPGLWSVRSTFGLVYLVFFGSIVGYSAFAYVLKTLPVSVVSTYNYVNPLVALGLGHLFYGERFGWQETSAMMVIFIGVAVVKWTSSAKKEPESSG